MEVSTQGLGCMGMSVFYGPSKPKPNMIKLIHYATNAGVTFLYTADVYGLFTNKLLLSKPLSEGVVRDKVELTTKFSISFEDNQMEIQGLLSYVRAACEGSLKCLGVDSIDLVNV
ncbi:probable aldo-keto reductase 2 [Rosa chinensis]|uniref:probable aldo-keto reductase 2 n=1 Tax=Rosa chinensis TaxID=74649 RepID=UPI000D088F4B|nr:probable aldo-keto reductase 2 [Rosa chinensis]